MLKALFGIGDENRKLAASLYEEAVSQARREVFYRECGVPDTVDGRFELIALHVFLLLHRLKSSGKKDNGLAQELFDAMFTDMDQALREMGAGDLGVGKRVKAMAKSFYGRISSYEAGITSDGDELAEAVQRNLYRGEDDTEDHAAKIAAYIRAQSAHLATTDPAASDRTAPLFQESW